MTPRVKIYGLKRAEDAELATRLGASYVGAIRAPLSPRLATLAEAERVFKAAGETPVKVLVYKGVPMSTISEEAEHVGITHVQVYDLTEKDNKRLESRGLTVYRVHRVVPETNRVPVLVPEPCALRPAMLDVGNGGSGRNFDWRMLGSYAPDWTFIAGGIRPENIANLLAHRPFGVDLSSGVEASPGIKDADRLVLFFERFQEALAGL